MNPDEVATPQNERRLFARRKAREAGGMTGPMPSEGGGGAGLSRMDLLGATALAGVSAWLLLAWSSPELTWDEAYRIDFTSWNWRALWWRYHESHGPMAIYLAKLGRAVLPDFWLGPEAKTRFFIALAGAASVALSYLGLRRVFATSRPAALAGACVLLFSVIRVTETNVFGPHHLMLVCTLALVLLGFPASSRPTPAAAVALGLALGLGATSMAYVVPVALVCLTASACVHRGWIAVRARGVSVSWPLLAAGVVASLTVLAIWPAGLLRWAILKDLIFFARFEGHATLVGQAIYGVAPRWSAAYWLAVLEAPLVVSFVVFVGTAGAIAFRSRRVEPRSAYLALAFSGILTITITAHLAGPRNLLQLIGVASLVVGASLDACTPPRGPARRIVAAGLIAGCALNLHWHAASGRYVPTIRTNGYRTFLSENAARVRSGDAALVYGLPVLRHYAAEAGIPVLWGASEIPWTAREDGEIPRQVSYVLLPEFVYRGMPAGHPMRRLTTPAWKRVWAYREAGDWDLSLFERNGAGR